MAGSKTSKTELLTPEAEVVFGWERLDVLFREPNLCELIWDQWIELSHLPDLEPNIDVEAMLAAEAAGQYRAWIARRDGLVIGFIQWMICRPFAYKGMLWAIDCGHFLDPLDRDIVIALRMWRSAEAALRELGVGMIRGHDNEHRPLDPFFKRLGYEKVSSMYQKKIDPKGHG